MTSHSVKRAVHVLVVQNLKVPIFFSFLKGNVSEVSGIKKKHFEGCASLTFAVTGGGVVGLTINDNGTFTFNTDDPTYDSLAVGDTRTETVTYAVTDSTGDSGSGSFDIVITGTNDAPVATFTTAQEADEDDVELTGTLTATDVDTDDTLTFSLIDTIDGLSLTDADWTFDPSDNTYQVLAAGAEQVITVNYKVTDSQSDDDQESFEITVTGVNDDPVATFNTQQDINEGSGTTEGQLTATDIDNGDDANLTFNDTTGGIAGLVINPDGSFAFDADNIAYDDLDLGDIVTENITYSVSDVLGGTDNGSFDIVITGTNDAPIATFVAPQVATEDGDTLNDTLTATDADASALLVFNLDLPIPGGLSLLGADWTFDPNDADYQPLAQDEEQVITVNYTVIDDHTAQGQGSFTITVTGVNDAPVGTPDAYTSSVDTELIVNQANGVLSNDSDIEEDNLTAVLDSDVSNGTLTLNADGSFNYIPSVGFIGDDSFTYFANDGFVDSESTTVTITVE